MQVTPRVALEVACHEAVIRQAYYGSVNVLTWSAVKVDVGRPPPSRSS